MPIDRYNNQSELKFLQSLDFDQLNKDMPTGELEDSRFNVTNVVSNAAADITKMKPLDLNTKKYIEVVSKTGYLEPLEEKSLELIDLLFSGKINSEKKLLGLVKLIKSNLRYYRESLDQELFQSSLYTLNHSDLFRVVDCDKKNYLYKAERKLLSNDVNKPFDIDLRNEGEILSDRGNLKLKQEHINKTFFLEPGASQTVNLKDFKDLKLSIRNPHLVGIRYVPISNSKLDLKKSGWGFMKNLTVNGEKEFNVTDVVKRTEINEGKFNYAIVNINISVKGANILTVTNNSGDIYGFEFSNK